MDIDSLRDLPAAALLQIIISQQSFYTKLESEHEFLKATICDLRQINLNLSSSLLTSAAAPCSIPQPKQPEYINGNTTRQHAVPQISRYIPPWAKTLVLSDSTYRKLKQQEIAVSTAIHSYSGATIIELQQKVDAYPQNSRAEHIIIHAGHNSIDNDVTPTEAAKSMHALATATVRKFRPLQVFISQIPPVKNGRYGREKNNPSIVAYNKMLEQVVLDLATDCSTTKFTLIINTLTRDDICPDGVHPSEQSGVKKIVTSIREAISARGIEAARGEPTVRSLIRRKLNEDGGDRGGGDRGGAARE